MSETDFIKAVRREYRRRQRIVEPGVRAALAQNPAMPPEYAVALVTAQNVIRNCMEVALQESMPQGQPFFVELAARTACYLLTALPPGEQEVGAMILRDGLLNKLGHMQSEGFTIQTEWED